MVRRSDVKSGFNFTLAKQDVPCYLARVIENYFSEKFFSKRCTKRIHCGNRCYPRFYIEVPAVLCLRALEEATLTAFAGDLAWVVVMRNPEVPALLDLHALEEAKLIVFSRPHVNFSWL